MNAPISDDDLLLILLRNLRNAANTFGEGTPPYEGIRTLVEEHLASMREKGLTTNLAAARRKEIANATPSAEETERQELETMFAKLVLRPKDGT